MAESPRTLTEQTAIEQALREERDRFRRVVSMIDDNVFIYEVDADLRFEDGCTSE